MALLEDELLRLINSTSSLRVNPFTRKSYSQEVIRWIARNVLLWEGFPQIYDPSLIYEWRKVLGPEFDRQRVKKYVRDPNLISICVSKLSDRSGKNLPMQWRKLSK